jgi:uncharacterized phage infection (PIP) family protein YhgE
MSDDIEAATKTLNDLKDQRDQLVARTAKISADLQAISYAAHASHDKAAKEKLRKLNDERVLHNAEIESVDAAITEATSRLSTAERDGNLAADRANAEQLREKLATFKEIGGQIDDALWDAANGISEMIALLNSMHALEPIQELIESGESDVIPCRGA